MTAAAPSTAYDGLSGRAVQFPTVGHPPAVLTTWVITLKEPRAIGTADGIELATRFAIIVGDPTRTEQDVDTYDTHELVLTLADPATLADVALVKVGFAVGTAAHARFLASVLAKQFADGAMPVGTRGTSVAWAHATLALARALREGAP